MVSSAARWRPTRYPKPRPSVPRADEPFLAATAEPVRAELEASVTLRDFLLLPGLLSLKDRKTLVDQAIVLLEQNYVHLPFKAALHAVSPIRRLKLLRMRLRRQCAEEMDAEPAFHAEMAAIFFSLHDLHTTYQLPIPYRDKIAYLPFLIEEYGEASAPHYIVTNLVQGYEQESPPKFEPGAEITHWNGTPIDRAVDVNAERFAGSNAAARHTRGVESLTLRSLDIHLPPDEEWVTISYVGRDGVAREHRQRWLVVDNAQRPVFTDDADGSVDGALAMGIDLSTDALSRARRLLYAPETIAQERQMRETGTLAEAAGNDVPTAMNGFFRARSVDTSSGTFGHIRIFSFYVDNPRGFVDEFVRLIGQLPQAGLIVDVRGNGGGSILASELTLQTLTPRRIAPEVFQFVNSDLNLRLCRLDETNSPRGLRKWARSIDTGLETGEVFSGAYAITPREELARISQQYHGPVVLVTDARCYSATDIFAAGFQDNGIGPVLGVDENTGAGGANVWAHERLMLLAEASAQPDADAESEPPSPYRGLPKGAGMGVAIRRALRVGDLAGTPLEDLGVIPDVRYDLTRDDLLRHNVDLLNRAGELLKAMTPRKLAATASESGGTLTMHLKVENLDRADVYVDTRPRASVDLTGPTATVTVDGVPGASVVDIAGYDCGALAAARSIAV